MDTRIEQQIREKAYYIWMAAGMVEGMAHEHWVTAEQVMLNEVAAATATPAKRKVATASSKKPSAKQVSVKPVSAKPVSAKPVASKAVASKATASKVAATKTAAPKAAVAKKASLHSAKIAAQPIH